MMPLPKKWAICFVDEVTPDNPLRWWDRIWTRPGFRHVFAMTYDPVVRRWLLMDWRTGGLFIGYIGRKEAENVIAYTMMNGVALEAWDNGAEEHNLLRIPIFYCVTAISLLLGIVSWRVRTPYQLYCELKRRGCAEIFTGEEFTT